MNLLAYRSGADASSRPEESSKVGNIYVDPSG